MINKLYIEKFVKDALLEDMGTGDITTLASVPAETVTSGKFTAKEDGVICGIEIAASVFSILDSEIVFTAHKKDGEKVKTGDIIAEISGNAINILTGERTAINILQHLSGIATMTAAAVEKVKSTKAKICDTRKTTPLLRVFEKYAVKTGGGYNHRFNLADGVLIKDNHIKAAGGIKKAVDSVRNNIPHTLKIEVECETMEEVMEALEAKADIIMLDNMTSQEMKKAVELIGDKAITEASGNMGDKDLAEVANTGVDYISIGALTRSVRSVDISLKFSE